MSVIVNAFFFEYGKHAPKNSNYSGLMSTNSLFGTWLEYTGREDAINNSMNQDEHEQLQSDIEISVDSEVIQPEIPDLLQGSFADYTSRLNATKRSNNDDKYFTMTNEGKLYTEAEKNRWLRNSSSAFSQKGDIAWSLVVSLDSFDTAKEYGLNDQRQWADVAIVALNKSFEKLHLNPNNMIWWQDFHTNTAHPHMHITFLEKENTRTRGKFTATEMKALKRTFITEMAARKTYYEKYMERATDALKEIQPLRKEVVQSAKKLSYTSMKSVLNLYSQLPTTGRLQYDSVHMAPYRKQLDDIVDDILKIDSVQKDYRTFKGKVCDLEDNVNSLGYEEVSNLWKQQDTKLRKQIANSILASFKEINKTDLKELKKMRVWKEKTSQEILVDVHQKFIKDPDIPREEKNVSEAIVANDFDKARELLKEIHASERTEFLENSITILDPKSTSREILNAKEKLFEAVKNKTHFVKRYTNFLRSGIPMNKQVHHQISHRVTPILKRSARSVIKAQGKEVEEEIEAFLQEKERLAAINHEEKIAAQFAERGGIEV